jgi:uncharacterized protein YbjT (DUF2867 family)
MSDRILVTGATGLQGGAVARHLLKLGKPEVRCLTRRPDSEAAKTFKQLGAEVVKADLDDPASLKSVLRGNTYAALGFPGARDLADMFEFLRVHVPNRRAEIAQCRRLYPSMQTFEPWLQDNARRFAALLSA